MFDSALPSWYRKGMGTNRAADFAPIVEELDRIALVIESRKMTPQQKRQRLAAFNDLKSKYEKRIQETTCASTKRRATASLGHLSRSIERFEKQLTS